MLVDPEEIREDRDRALPAATVTALESTSTRHLDMDARLDCDLCDDDGYRANALVCNHIDRTDIHRAGMTAVRAAIAKGATADANEPQKASTT